MAIKEPIDAMLKCQDYVEKKVEDVLKAIRTMRTNDEHEKEYTKRMKS
jgi:hypothetical protein